VDKRQVKFSSLVGKDALIQSFGDVVLGMTSAADLWEKVSTSKVTLSCITKVLPTFLMLASAFDRMKSYYYNFMLLLFM
jgi:hypothetical protein